MQLSSIAAGLFLAAVTAAAPAFSADKDMTDHFTAKVTAVDDKTGIITLDDNSSLVLDTKTLVVGKPAPGATVTVIYVATENGYDPLLEVRVVDPKPAPKRVN